MPFKVAISLVLLLCCAFFAHGQDVVSIGDPTPTESNSIVQKATIFPNPGIGLVALERKQPFTNAHIRVLSITGTVEETKRNFNGPICGLDLTGLAQGIYFVEIIEGDRREVLKWERE